MSNKKINVAIDGYSGCGKSTTAKAVAHHIGYTYIDTGAMYRAVTLYFLRSKINIDDSQQVEEALNDIKIRFVYNDQTGKSHTYLNGEDVEEEIRKPEVASYVSPVAAISAVRKSLVQQQQEMGKEKGVIMDGRDIGTVVFPDAECKFFMTADPDIRAQRRVEELKLAGVTASFDEVRENLLERDRIDSNRADSPLMKAEDAIIIDTSHITIDDQIKIVIDRIKEEVSQKA